MRSTFLFIGLLLTRAAFSQVVDSAMRHVVLQGAINFRDLGGYATADGHHVKWHMIYRSADISKLTQADLDTLKARHILYDVDLRACRNLLKRRTRRTPERIISFAPQAATALMAPCSGISVKSLMATPS